MKPIDLVYRTMFAELMQPSLDALEALEKTHREGELADVLAEAGR